MDFKARKVIRDKKGEYRIKGPILQEDITILNEYVPNNRASNHVRQKLIELQREIDESTIIVGDFNTLYQIWTDPAGQRSERT